MTNLIMEVPIVLYFLSIQQYLVPLKTDKETKEGTVVAKQGDRSSI